MYSQLSIPFLYTLIIYFNLGGCDEPNNVAEYKLHASSFPLKAVCVFVCEPTVRPVQCKLFSL